MNDEERVSQCDECLRWVYTSRHTALDCYSIAEKNWLDAKSATAKTLTRMNRAADRVRAS